MEPVMAWTMTKNVIESLRYIVLKTNSNLVIHALRKCLIHIKDAIKAKLEVMVTQGIIRKIDEPTNWVNSIE